MIFQMKMLKFLLSVLTITSASIISHIYIDHLCGTGFNIDERIVCVFENKAIYTVKRYTPNVRQITFNRFPASQFLVDDKLPHLEVLIISNGDDINGCDCLISQRPITLVLSGRPMKCDIEKSTPATPQKDEISTESLTSTTSASTTSALTTSVSTTSVSSPTVSTPSTLTSSTLASSTPVSSTLASSSHVSNSTPVPTQTTVITMAAALGVTILMIIILIICHWLRITRIRRLHFPLAHVSLESSSPSTTTPGFKMKRSLSDSTLNTIVSSPISYSTPTPLVSTPHRYPTRFQKRLIN